MEGNQLKETGYETRISEKAQPDEKPMNYYQSEFFERLDFLVTFLAMKKVTQTSMTKCHAFRPKPAKWQYSGNGMIIDPPNR